MPLRLSGRRTPAQPANDGKLRIIVFRRAPDDAEYRGAGVVAMKWAKMGHHVSWFPPPTAISVTGR
jgi:hypothetical protein